MMLPTSMSTIDAISLAIDVLIVGVAAAVASRIRAVSADLGPAVIRLPSRISKWVPRFVLGFAIFKAADAFWTMNKGVVTSLPDFDIALFYFLGAILLRRMSKGGVICRGGIDLGSMVFPWSEIETWNWSAARCSLELRVTSPWRFFLGLRQPVRYKTPYNAELDHALRETSSLAPGQKKQ